MVEKKFNVSKGALGAHLGQLKGRLERYRAGVMVAVLALKHQNADADEDVALTLQRNVADPLWVEIELIEGLRKDCEGQGRPAGRVKAKKKSRK